MSTFSILILLQYLFQFKYYKILSKFNLKELKILLFIEYI